MKEKERKEAANRLMDGITDLKDELILTADQPVKKDARGRASDPGRTRRTVIGVSFAAAVLIAAVITLVVLRGSGSGDGRTKTMDTSMVDDATVVDDATEAFLTEAGTEEAVTEAVATEAPATEAGATEAVVTEAGTEAVTEAHAGDEVRHGEFDSKAVSYASLAEMEEDAELIVRAVRLEKEKPVIQRIGGRVASGYTESEVRITKIYKDSTGELTEGATLTILENEVYDADTDMKYHAAGYNMMVPGEEYILFLKRSYGDVFCSCGVNYGTVSTAADGRDVSAKNPNGVELTDMNLYRKIWTEAGNKYR